METYKRLLLANRAWAHEKTSLKPDFFGKLADGQTPEFLWIGCSDSRVPAEDITGVEPGEIFVHRNIANQFIPGDFNAESVVQYAVQVLRVKHIIVCGHYGCGGVRAALSNNVTGAIDRWLLPIRTNRTTNQAQLDPLPEEVQIDRMVELSVKAQVANLAKSDLVRNAWKEGEAPLIHGWVFGLKDGLLRNLTTHGRDSSPV